MSSRTPYLNASLPLVFFCSIDFDIVKSVAYYNAAFYNFEGFTFSVVMRRSFFRYEGWASFSLHNYLLIDYAIEEM